MGDRGQIKYTYTDGTSIRFYTHWTGTELPETLAAALDRGRPRWNDDSYLARIIFSEMIAGHVFDETGFGIAPYDMGPDHDEITVSVKDSTVQVGAGAAVSFDSFITGHKGPERKTTRESLLDVFDAVEGPVTLEFLITATGKNGSEVLSVLQDMRFDRTTPLSNDSYGRWSKR